MFYFRRLACVALLLYLIRISTRSHSGRTKETVNAVLDRVIIDLIPPDNHLVPRDVSQMILNSQSYLFCLIKDGKWTVESSSWPYFTLGKTCWNSDVLSKLSLTASVDICRLLPGKRILFVGPETTFYLHSLWLASIESHEGRSLTCLGHEFCTFHHICQTPATNMSFSEEFSGRKKKIPGRNTLVALNSSLLQFSFSMTLNTSRKQQDRAYIEHVLDEQTGIRVLNSYWLNRARRADVIIINRSPVPAPATTYGFQRSKYGNWTFALATCAQNDWLYPMTCNSTLESSLTNAALYITMDYFLPEVLSSVKTIRRDNEISKALLVWQSSWFIQPICAIAALPAAVPLLQDIWSSGDPTLVDPWTFYYNAQAISLVYMHERILRSVLPHFNITYVPLTMSAYVSQHSRFRQEIPKLSAKHTKDCLREPWPNFGSDSLEVVFFTALESVLRSR